MAVDIYLLRKYAVAGPEAEQPPAVLPEVELAE
jgi:hypothetical protein